MKVLSERDAGERGHLHLHNDPSEGWRLRATGLVTSCSWCRTGSGVVWLPGRQGRGPQWGKHVTAVWGAAILLESTGATAGVAAQVSTGVEHARGADQLPKRDRKNTKCIYAAREHQSPWLEPRAGRATASAVRSELWSRLGCHWYSETACGPNCKQCHLQLQD